MLLHTFVCIPACWRAVGMLQEALHLAHLTVYLLLTSLFWDYLFLMLHSLFLASTTTFPFILCISSLLFITERVWMSVILQYNSEKTFFADLCKWHCHPSFLTAMDVTGHLNIVPTNNTVIKIFLWFWMNGKGKYTRVGYFHLIA